MKILAITASILLFAAPAHAQFTQEQCYARSDAHRTYLQHSRVNGASAWHQQRHMWLRSRRNCSNYPTAAQLNPRPPVYSTTITQADITQFVQTRSLIK